MPQDNPPLLDKTMNTTESTPRNLADVLASGLANIANNVKPDGSDISIDVPGMSANNVDDGFSELKGTLDDKVNKSVLNNVRFKTYMNALSIELDLEVETSTSVNAHLFLFNANQGVCALIRGDSPYNVTIITGSRTFTVSKTGTVLTITPDSRLWGLTTVMVDYNHS